MGVTLRCTEGPLAGETLTVEAELPLGREVPEPGRLGGDPRLSRRHARLFIDAQQRLVVEDLGSTNGTWVNGDRLSAPCVLAAGDELRVGQTIFEVPAQAAATQIETPTAGATLPHAATVASPQAIAPAPSYLQVVEGPMQGEQITLGDELLIGRGFGGPGALGGDRQLSRRHARIARGPGGVYYVEDTGSTNGTLLNGEVVHRARPVSDGDEIKLGSSTLRVTGMPSTPLAAELPPRPASAPAPAVGVPVAVGAQAQWPPFGAQEAAMSFAPQGAAGARMGSHRLVAIFAAVFVAAGVVAAVAVLIAAPATTRLCPSGFICHKPPTAPALRALATFTGGLGWRAEYDQQAVTLTTANPGGNQLILHESSARDRLWGANPGAQLVSISVRGYPAGQVSPTSAMQSMASSLDSKLVGAATAPTSDQIFGNPVLGFHPAQGEVLEGSQQTPQGPGGLVKVVVLAATQGNVTVAAGVVTPLLTNAAANLTLERFGDQFLETIRFPSDGAT